MNDGSYKLELTDPILGRCIGYFKTAQDRYDNLWHATGYIRSIDPDTKNGIRTYGCSKSYETEVEGIDALIQAECATDIIWL